MQIIYCDNCGLRIADKDFETGRAVKTGERNFCEKCAPKMDARGLASTPAPASARGSGSKIDPVHASPPIRNSATGITPANRYNINHAADAQAQRHPPAPSPQSGMPIVPIAAGIGALALGVILLLSGGSSPPVKPSAITNVSTGVRVAANDRHASTTSQPLINSTPEPRRTPTLQNSGPSEPDIPPPANKGPNPEQVAETALNKVLNFEGLASDDRDGRIKALNAYLAVYGDTMVSTRAWQMVKKLRAEAHERELAQQMPATVITGAIESPTPPAAAGTAGEGNAASAQPKTVLAKSSESKVLDTPEPKRNPASAPNPLAKSELAAVRKELAPILEQCRFSAALEVLERRIREPAMSDAKALLLEDKADLESVVQLRQSAIDAVRAMAGKRVTLKRSKSDLTGTISADPSRPGIALKSGGGMVIAFLPDQFQAQDIDTFAPLRTGADKTADLRARGILFFAINDLSRARESLKLAQDAGANVGSYLERIDAVEQESIEARARQEWSAAESAFQIKRYEPAEKAYQNFKAKYGKTKMYAQVETQLKQRLDAIDPILHPLQEGLLATYFRAHEFRGEDILLDRIDGTIDFNWEKQQPAPNVPHDDFTARWTGLLKADRGGKYTFTTIVDDNARLWIDGRQVLNDWDNAHAAKPIKGSIEIDEGYHELKLEYRQFNGPAMIRLMWSLKDTFPDTVIPPEALWHRATHK